MTIGLRPGAESVPSWGELGRVLVPSEGKRGQGLGAPAGQCDWITELGGGAWGGELGGTRSRMTPHQECRWCSAAG